MATTRALARVFLEQVADAAGFEAVPVSTLERSLGELVAAAHAAWPELPHEPEAFVGYVAQRFTSSEDAMSQLASLRGDDLFLAFACAHGVLAAVTAFEERYLQSVPKLLAQSGHTDDALADEVQQFLREKLLLGREGKLPKISDYSGRGALMNWLRMAAVRTALNIRIKERKHVPSAEPPVAEEALAGGDPELEYIKEKYLEDFRAAFREAFAALGAEERNLLRFKLVDGLNIDAIGVIFGKHRATIARWIAQTREGIASAVRENLRRRLRIEGSELESMLGLMRSRLDVTLRGYLKGSGHGDST